MRVRYDADLEDAAARAQDSLNAVIVMFEHLPRHATVPVGAMAELLTNMAVPMNAVLDEVLSRPPAGNDDELVALVKYELLKESPPPS